MGDNWGGYANGKIPTSAMLKVQNDWFKPDVGHALISAITECAKHGIAIHINEGYRPLGIPADQNIRDENKTSTRSSNQWFQYGRMKRGETPAAATPGQSIHGWGKAADVSPGRDNSTVAGIFAKYGFKFDIASESWHAHFVGTPALTPEPTAIQKLTWKGLQGYLKAYWGYTGVIDGKPGKGTWTSCQRWLAAHWLYKGTIDGVPGPQTYAAMQRAGCKLR
jgi:hypothetical protein